MTINYRNAFAEVFEILNYLNEDDYKKIPKDVIEAIEKNRNLEYVYYIDESIEFVEQKILPETKGILYNLFKDYLCTKRQKEIILNYQQKQMLKLEEEKKYG